MGLIAVLLIGIGLIINEQIILGSFLIAMVIVAFEAHRYVTRMMTTLVQEHKSRKELNVNRN